MSQDFQESDIIKQVGRQQRKPSQRLRTLWTENCNDGVCFVSCVLALGSVLSGEPVTSPPEL